MGFIDDNPKLAGARIGGIYVYSTTEFTRLCNIFNIKTLIIAIQNPILSNQKNN